MKRYFLLVASLTLFISTYCQEEGKTVLTGEEARKILDIIKIDTAVFLSNSGRLACECIDSVIGKEKDHEKLLEGFAYCINDQVIAYQVALKIAASMHSASKDNDISLVTNKNSSEYKIYYYRIESWLVDSCEVLKRAIASNDKANDLSFSKNEEALEAYYAGVDFLRKNDHASALPYFKKAVETDSIFVFAWDNLGICYRKTGDLENAEKAYRESLKLDPSGETALQNLPVVYLIQKKDNEAIAAYNNILKYHPKNPEAYYGMGLVYFQNKLDMVNALQNMCKAYNIYIEMKSPYRSDAEKVINSIYHEMKKQGKEEDFYRILKENNINAN